MTRQLRVEYPGAIYDVIGRCDRKEDMFPIAILTNWRWRRSSSGAGLRVGGIDGASGEAKGTTDVNLPVVPVLSAPGAEFGLIGAGTLRRRPILTKFGGRSGRGGSTWGRSRHENTDDLIDIRGNDR